MNFRPVNQTILGDTHLANCLQAAVASVMGIPIDEVPNFMTFDGPNGHAWFYMALRLFFRSRGLNVRFTHGKEVAPNGYAIACGPVHPSRGEGYHAIVVRDGIWLHDPHPDRKYLESVTYYVSWEPIAHELDKEFIYDLEDTLKLSRIVADPVVR